jgi:DNA-binding transcriptional MerR regulator
VAAPVRLGVPANDKEKARQIRFLQSRGFSLSAIIKLLRNPPTGRSAGKTISAPPRLRARFAVPPHGGSPSQPPAKPRKISGFAMRAHLR